MPRNTTLHTDVKPFVNTLISTARRVVALLAVLALGACEIATENVSSPVPRIVVHSVLNPDAHEQVVLVESSLTGRVAIDSTRRFDPSDPIRSAGGEPLSNASVHLFRENDTVGVVAVERPLGTGRYTVLRDDLAIEPGTRYRLRVRAPDGREVTGETRVPAEPAGLFPGERVARPYVSFNRSVDTLRLSWAPSDGARTYAIRIATPNGPWFLFSDSTRFALAGTLRNFFADGIPSVFYPGFDQFVDVGAVDANFYDYNRSGNDPFGGTGLISSVRGGLGLFGSTLPLVQRSLAVTERDRFPLDARWVGRAGVASDSTEYDLWIDSPGSPRASVSGRERTGFRRYLVGTLEGDQLRLITLEYFSTADTAAVFTAVVRGDTIRGTYRQGLSSGPEVFVRRPRIRP